MDEDFLPCFRNCRFCPFCQFEQHHTERLITSEAATWSPPGYKTWKTCTKYTHTYTFNLTFALLWAAEGRREWDNKVELCRGVVGLHTARVWVCVCVHSYKQGSARLQFVVTVTLIRALWLQMKNKTTNNSEGWWLRCYEKFIPQI